MFKESKLKITKAYVSSIKAFLYIIFALYAAFAIMLFAVPDYKNVFTLVSCLSTICTLCLGGILATVKFSKTDFFDSFLRVISLWGMFFLYCIYLKAEFAIISTNFNFISLGFDLGTSLQCFVIVKSFWKNHG